MPDKTREQKKRQTSIQARFLCPVCGAGNIEVLETRCLADRIKRRRGCKECGFRFTTDERIRTTQERGDVLLRDFEWWSGTAKHMWRAYFSMQARNSAPDTIASRNIYTACNTIYSRLSRLEQQVLNYHYVAKIGQKRVSPEDVARRFQIKTEDVVTIINKANRDAVIAIGIAEQRGDAEY